MRFQNAQQQMKPSKGNADPEKQNEAMLLRFDQMNAPMMQYKSLKDLQSCQYLLVTKNWIITRFCYTRGKIQFNSAFLGYLLRTNYSTFHVSHCSSCFQKRIKSLRIKIPKNSAISKRAFVWAYESLPHNQRHACPCTVDYLGFFLHIGKVTRTLL